MNGAGLAAALVCFVAFSGCQEDDDGPKSDYRAVAGTYRCLSYTVNGGGGNCYIHPALELGLDGRYTFSSDSGRYQYRNALLYFDGEMGERGPANYNEDRQITWAFEQDGSSIGITYYLVEAAYTPPDGEAA